MTQKERLAQRYTDGRISKAMLKAYVKTGRITAEDYEHITGEVYAAAAATVE